eukprot:291197-Amphidinium_carterae.1
MFQLPAESPVRVLIHSPVGNAIATDRTEQHKEANVSAFCDILPTLVQHRCVSDVKYSQWVILEFKDENFIKAVYVAISKFSDICGVLKCGLSCSAIFRRSNIRKKIPDMTIFGLTKIFSLKAATRDMNTASVTTLKAWIECGEFVIRNFDIVQMENEDFGWRDLELQWQGVAQAEKEAQVLDADEKVRMKKQCTYRERVIASMGKKVLQLAKDMIETTPSYVMFADDVRIINRFDFINLDRVVCKSFDPSTGMLVMYSIEAWIEAEHRRHSLVIYGDSDLGKTQLAKTISAELATKLQEGEKGRAFFLKTETVDSL